MAEKTAVLLDFHGADNVLVRKIAEHTGLPKVHVVRMAVRYFAQNGPWVTGSEDLREDILKSATVVGIKEANAKRRKKATQ